MNGSNGRQQWAGQCRKVQSAREGCEAWKLVWLQPGPAPAPARTTAITSDLDVDGACLQYVDTNIDTHTVRSGDQARYYTEHGMAGRRMTGCRVPCHRKRSQSRSSAMMANIAAVVVLVVVAVRWDSG